MVDPIDRVVQVVEPASGRATERLATFARQVIAALTSGPGLVKSIASSAPAGSVTADTSGELFAATVTLPANALRQGDMLTVVARGDAGAPASASVSETYIDLIIGGTTVAELTLGGAGNDGAISGFEASFRLSLGASTYSASGMSLAQMSGVSGVGSTFTAPASAVDFTAPNTIAIQARTESSTRSVNLIDLQISIIKSP